VKTFGHQLLKASAGTGKTHRLTNQFLTLLFAEVQPETVLATTFTRKAAGEILDRLLERLVGATDSEEGLAELRRNLEKPELDAATCKRLLGRLTRALGTLEVRTIDSFLNRLVNLFSHDLDLPPHWTICDEREAKALQALAIGDVLEQGDPEDLSALLHQLHSGGAPRGVQAALLKLAAEMLPLVQDSDPEAWNQIAVGPEVEKQAVLDALEGLRGAIMPLTKKGTENQRWAKARDKLLLNVSLEDWKAVLSKGLGAAYHSENRTYFGAEMPLDLLEILAPIMAQASFKFLSNLVARNLAARQLLDRFSACLSLRKYESGHYRFEDIPVALDPSTERAQLFAERQADLWFRLDSKLDHILLDEFQDTSPIQWRILEPLASEITSAGGPRSFFCVGDGKQSIYGFRQAEPRLLNSLETRLPGLEAEAMHLSFRSSQVVLDLVNRVFGGLEKNLALGSDPTSPERLAADAWSESMHEHTAVKDLPGAVQVIEVTDMGDTKKDEVSALVRCTVQRVKALLAEAKGCEVEIGVLTRVNKHIPLLISSLRAEKIDASGEGGNTLTDSAAVLLFVSLLHLADHPGDEAAAFHVASSPFAGYLGLAPKSDPSEERADMRALARRVRSDLMAQGLGALAENLNLEVQADPSWPAWDKARMAQLSEQAHRFEARISLRASDFVDHLRIERVEAPGGSRVRVMTVHAAKGLEFDCVVLPELNAKMVGTRDRHLARRPDPAGRIDLVTFSPGQELLGTSTQLKSLYDAGTEKAIKDSLCGLYVAMTRARYRLELVVPGIDADKDQSKLTASLASVLRGSLPQDELIANDPDGVIWRATKSGEKNWAEYADRGSDAVPAAEVSLGLAPTTGLRSLARRRASAEEGGALQSAGALLKSNTGAEVGTLAHAAFDGCEWIEDFEFAPADLARLGAKQDILRSATAIVEGALACDEIRKALSREASGAPPASKTVVHQEYGFTVLLKEDSGGPEQVWNGSIDRLVLATENGRVVWAEVIDFKSDAVEAGELEARAEHYRPQLEAYARVVAEQTGLTPEKVRLRLLFLSPGRVVDLV